jgi:TolB-like protein
MIYEFGDCRLDLGAHELIRAGQRVALEPQVFALLELLVENRDRLISRDEIINTVWDGRIVSEAALSSRIKSARAAIGDDGRGQRWIHTHHRLGYRFIGDVRAPSVAVAASAEELVPTASPSSRPSIAVLPFSPIDAAGPYGPIADALPHDLIVELSRLRWLFVIARGSSFRLRGSEATPERARAAFGVGYCVSGVVEIAGGRLIVTVELCDTGDGHVIWSETYREAIDAVHEVRGRIAHAVVAALELQIPLSEAQRAMASPDNLDAWAAFHLGLHHMFRFDQDGTDRAAGLFERAIAREPSFARARAGLSFAHFERAFLKFAPNRTEAVGLARRFAEESLELDPLDPFCNLVMGRAAWLTGELEVALPWLDRAVELNPNFAQAKYSAAWTRTLLGLAAEGQSLVDEALELSPLDPLLYGMLGVRAMSHMVRDEPEVAALWGERAARSPRAHVFIDLIAAAAHGLNGDIERAQNWAATALARRPGLRSADFFEAFPFRRDDDRERIAAALRRLAF